MTQAMLIALLDVGVMCLTWRGLTQVSLSALLKAWLVMLVGILTAVILFWGIVYISIILFQLNDPIGW